MTQAQTRLLDLIRSQGDGGAEYWPTMNEWVKDAGPARALALRNITRTVTALLREGYVSLNDDGLLRLTGKR